MGRNKWCLACFALLLAASVPRPAVGDDAAPSAPAAPSEEPAAQAAGVAPPAAPEGESAAAAAAAAVQMADTATSAAVDSPAAAAAAANVTWWKPRLGYKFQYQLKVRMRPHNMGFRRSTCGVLRRRCACMRAHARGPNARALRPRHRCCLPPLQMAFDIRKHIKPGVRVGAGSPYLIPCSLQPASTLA